MNDNSPFEDAPLNFSYTRAQAIEDGVLVDLTAWAKETGFRIPVACTSTVWQKYIVRQKARRSSGNPSAAEHTTCCGCSFVRSVHRKALIQRSCGLRRSSCKHRAGMKRFR